MPKIDELCNCPAFILILLRKLLYRFYFGFVCTGPIIFSNERQNIYESRRRLLDEKFKSNAITWDKKNEQELQYANVISEESSFTQVYNRYEYINTHKGTQFVYDLGYNKLFGIDGNNYGLDGTRYTSITKIFISIIITVLLFICAYLTM